MILALGAVKDFGGVGEDAANLLGLLLLAYAVIREFQAVHKETAPLRARAALRVSLLAERTDADDEAKDPGVFCASLLALGYENAHLAADSTESGGDAVILFHPNPATAPATVAAIRELNPTALVLVYSFVRIDGLRLSNDVIAANSAGRLLLDLGVRAEMVQSGMAG